MKKLSLFFIVSIFGMMTVFAQSKAKSPEQDFLDRYLTMVEQVEAIDNDNVDNEKLEELKATYKELTKELSKHKSKMTNTELESYYNYKARYQKKIAIIKTRRSGKAVQGWVKGLF